MVLAYLRRTSGLRPTQITRLVARWIDNRLAQAPLAKRHCAPAAPFARKYTASDIELLVEMGHANEDVCGPAIAHLLHRAYNVYGDTRYERLTDLSVSHLYNLRKSTGYQRPAYPLVPRLVPCATPSACARHHGPMDALAGCALTASAKATSMASRGSITSPAWTASASGRSRPASRVSARHSCW